MYIFAEFDIYASMFLNNNIKVYKPVYNEILS